MDADKAPKGKGKGKARQLVEWTGSQRCVLCVSHNVGCWVDVVAVKKWKEAVARGVEVKRTPLGTLCNECAVKKQKCFLPKLARERRLLLPLGKRKRDEELEASGSKVRTKAAGTGTRATESPKKKKTRVEVVMPPRAGMSTQVELEGGECGEKLMESIAGVIVGVANGLAALVRAVRETNEVTSEAVEHLRTIADYFAQRLESDNDFGSELDWTSGDEKVVDDVEVIPDAGS